MTTTSHASAPALAAQHTPGPWMPDGIQNNSAATTSIIIRTERGGNESHGRAPYVAEVSWPRDGLRRTDSAITDEDWANARLIASAPDLLAALEAAHRSLVTCNSCHGIGTLPTASERTEIESATLLARVAIAKAKGTP